MKRWVTLTLTAVLAAAATADSIVYSSGAPQIAYPAPVPVVIRSGFIPLACYGLQDSPQLVDCWLQEIYRVADAMVWEPHGKAALPEAYRAWPDWRKADLRQAYTAAVAWHDGGMTHWTGTPVDHVPVNIESQYYSQDYKTVLDEDSAAWPIYVAHLGFAMAAELHAWVPWSLRDYSTQELKDLFTTTGFNIFEYDTPPITRTKGYAVEGAATPTHPTVTWKFLADNHLFGATPRLTVDRVLDWARANLWHFSGPPVADNQFVIWQYFGAPPVARVLAGTTSLANPYGGDTVNPHHWTEGCYGTTALLKWVLRVVNIPVETKASDHETCGHTMPYFPSLHAYLSHGDDPYDQLSKGAPIDSLLVNEPVWNAWFKSGNATTSCNNVGREPLELAIWYLPDYLVGQYCTDVLAGLDHAHGSVYQDYKNIYTVGQLEEDDLWTRLPARVATTTAWQCAPLQQHP